MDTDNLTEQAYETISRAADVLDVLRAEIGASARKYKTEDEFLKGTSRWLDEILDDPSGYLDSWNYIETVNESGFVAGLHALKEHIQRTLAHPIAERGAPEF